MVAPRCASSLASSARERLSSCNLIRAVALEKRLVTMHADLGPDRRLHATGGQARSLYAELSRNLATRAKPEGGASPAWSSGSSDRRSAGREQDTAPTKAIHQRLGRTVGAHRRLRLRRGRSLLLARTRHRRRATQERAMRWLRGEYATRTDARRALGVRTIMDDANFYDHLKLMARFIRQAGYEDCWSASTKWSTCTRSPTPSPGTPTTNRFSNPERLPSGTRPRTRLPVRRNTGVPADTRRGLFSYAALQSRLAENTYATEGIVDLSGPVLRLSSLSAEDFYVLLTKLRHVYAAGDQARVSASR